MNKQETETLIEQMTKNLYDSKKCNQVGFLQSCKQIDLENEKNIRKAKSDLARGNNRNERLIRQSNKRYNKLQSDIFTAIKGQ